MPDPRIDLPAVTDWEVQYRWLSSEIWTNQSYWTGAYVLTSNTTATNAVTWGQWIASDSQGGRRLRRPAQRDTWNVVAAADTAVRERRATVERANVSAEALLRSCLTEEQKAEYDALGRFRVTAASGRVYVIMEGYAGNVVSQGWRYCIHGPETLPHADQMLMQKLLIETDEAEFLRLANASLNHQNVPMFEAA